MRQLYAHDANESNRRLVEDGMSTGLTNTETARGLSVRYHVFAQKQCILGSALRHKSYLALALELSRTALIGCSLAITSSSNKLKNK